MAFYKEIETERGIVTTYHTVTVIALDKEGVGVTQLLIDSWITEEAKMEGKLPFERGTVFIPTLPPPTLTVAELPSWAYGLLSKPENAKYFNVEKYRNGEPV